MKIKIYQVNMDRDDNRVAFMGLAALPKFQGNAEPKSALYDSVFEGDVMCKTLEDVYATFNRNHPVGYKARSLSVSDVVEVVEDKKIEPGFYFCDSIGFQKVSFDPKQTQRGEQFCKADEVKTIDVLLVKPGMYPKMIQIEDTLEAMQQIVGGNIEEYMPFEDEVALVCNEEGKVNGLPLNRAIYAEPEEIDMTYQEMKKRFQEAEKSGGQHLTGYIVFSQDSFKKPYSVESRTYEVSSDNKAFQSNMRGYSIFADAVDGSDFGVRIEQYMTDEYGGADGWKVERCYVKEDAREMMDIVAGDFFIAGAPIDAQNFQSLTPKQAEKYRKLFKYPEKFFRDGDNVIARQYLPAQKDMER
jgi:hypothetical protein